jgi:hypothetical protein
VGPISRPPGPWSVASPETSRSRCRDFLSLLPNFASPVVASLAGICAYRLASRGIKVIVLAALLAGSAAEPPPSLLGWSVGLLFFFFGGGRIMDSLRRSLLLYTWV